MNLLRVSLSVIGVSLVLAVSMLMNSEKVFLVQQFDPAIGLWRSMEYTDVGKAKFAEVGLASPSKAELSMLYTRCGKEIKGPFMIELQERYPVFARRFTGVGRRQWSISNRLFYVFIGLAAVGSILSCVAIVREHNNIRDRRC